ncbi:MAG: hypothetical protein M1833_005350 [Piccolia ochrophora]|nr:MAG: hypothetical protein M1833_005350 [Piccolia ochrophora]
MSAHLHWQQGAFTQDQTKQLRDTLHFSTAINPQRSLFGFALKAPGVRADLFFNPGGFKLMYGVDESDYSHYFGGDFVLPADSDTRKVSYLQAFEEFPAMKYHNSQYVAFQAAKYHYSPPKVVIPVPYDLARSLIPGTPAGSLSLELVGSKEDAREAQQQHLSETTYAANLHQYISLRMPGLAEILEQVNVHLHFAQRSGFDSTLSSTIYPDSQDPALDLEVSGLLRAKMFFLAEVSREGSQDLVAFTRDLVSTNDYMLTRMRVHSNLNYPEEVIIDLVIEAPEAVSTNVDA